MDKRLLEDCLARGMSLEAIGESVGRHPSTVGYWLKKHRLTANGSKKYARRGPIARDALNSLVDEGATLAEIAREFDRSISTVRYWLAHYEIETANSRGPRPRSGDGSKTAVFECGRHGRTDFILERRGYYRCKRCRSAAVARHRRTVKQKLVNEAGDACVLCGYDRWIGALHFHHIEPSAKEFHIAHRGHSRSLARSRAEIRKCALLCANCHAEVEGGFATLPVGLGCLSGDASG